MPQVAALTVLGHGLVCDRASQASISRRGRFLVESARGAPRGSGGQLGPPSTSAPPAPGPSSPTRPGNHVNPTDTDASPTGGSANRPGDPPGSPRLPTKPGPTPPHSARVSHEVTGPGRSSRPVTYEGQCADVWSGTRTGMFSDPTGIESKAYRYAAFAALRSPPASTPTRPPTRRATPRWAPGAEAPDAAAYRQVLF